MAVPSAKERDARLDKLSEAVKQWATKNRTGLQTQLDLSKRLLRGRTGADRLNNTTVSQAGDLLVDGIEQFLTGE